jgi:hypothetical protein
MINVDYNIGARGAYATAKSPKEVGVLVWAGSKHIARSGNDLKLQCVVRGQTVKRGQGTVTAALNKASGVTYGLQWHDSEDGLGVAHNHYSQGSVQPRW